MNSKEMSDQNFIQNLNLHESEDVKGLNEAQDINHIFESSEEVKHLIEYIETNNRMTENIQNMGRYIMRFNDNIQFLLQLFSIHSRDEQKDEEENGKSI
jgi:hypothetical protein